MYLSLAILDLILAREGGEVLTGAKRQRLDSHGSWGAAL
jgi:hypothetical protein